MSEERQYYVYILFSKKNGTLYVGVTSDLVKRVWQHKNKLVKGFTQKYNVDKLGYYEVSNDINSAIAREKQLKGGSRQTKLDLIEINNPNWNDLYYEIIYRNDMALRLNCFTSFAMTWCYRIASLPIAMI